MTAARPSPGGFRRAVRVSYRLDDHDLRARRRSREGRLGHGGDSLGRSASATHVRISSRRGSACW